jgi:hypothetical protein
MKRKLFTAFTMWALLAASMPMYAQGLSKITRGPLSGGCGPAPMVGMDRVSGQVFSCPADALGSNAWTGQQITLSQQGIQTALTTVTTAQTMFTFTPGIAGLMNVANKHLRVSGHAFFSNGATTPAITISLKIGATTVASVVGAANANTNTNAPLEFQFDISTSTIGATGTDLAHGWMNDSTAAAWASGTLLAHFVDGSTAATSGYDHTANNAIAVQIAATAVLTSVTPMDVTYELVN